MTSEIIDVDQWQRNKIRDAKEALGMEGLSEGQFEFIEDGTIYVHTDACLTRSALRRLPKFAFEFIAVRPLEETEEVEFRSDPTGLNRIVLRTLPPQEYHQ